MTRTLWWRLGPDRVPVPCDAAAAELVLADIKARRVALDYVGGCKVSTVFLCLDHSFTGKGPPLLFETMTFLADGTPADRRRYATWNEALAGHALLLDQVRHTARALAGIVGGARLNGSRNAREGTYLERRLRGRRDNCTVCHGARGGVRGNENVINGVVMCDYCHATIEARGAP